MSDCETTRERLHQLFREELHLEVPSPDVDLLATGLIDSLQFVELLSRLEACFGTHISLDGDFNLDHFRSLARIEAFLESRSVADKQLL